MMHILSNQEGKNGLTRGEIPGSDCIKEDPAPIHRRKGGTNRQNITASQGRGDGGYLFCVGGGEGWNTKLWCGPVSSEEKTGKKGAKGKVRWEKKCRSQSMRDGGNKVTK